MSEHIWCFEKVGCDNLVILLQHVNTSCFLNIFNGVPYITDLMYRIPPNCSTPSFLGPQTDHVSNL